MPAPPAAEPKRVSRVPLSEFAALALLCWTIGVLDTFAYDTYRVYTTNQAGNIIVVAHIPWQDTHQVTLATLSLSGTAIGVVVGTWVSRRVRRQSETRLMAALIAGNAFLILAAIVTLGGSRPEWLVPVLAAGTACIAAGWMATANLKAWLTGYTGSFLSLVRSTAFSDGKRNGRAGRFVKASSQIPLVMTLSFAAGVATYSVVDTGWVDPVIVALVPILAIILVLIWRSYSRQSRQ